MPLNGAVFALDGILIGAGDTRFLMWGMLAAAAAYIPIALLALDQDWGILGVWWGLAALIVIRLATCGARFASQRWAMTGPEGRSPVKTGHGGPARGQSPSG
jgi:Na+-driven multidrug efflux pump